MKISIITATWNSAATVRDTMESVLRQTHQDWEHIIVDGASSDSTMEIVRELEPRYGGRLRYVSERDRGIYDAMNKGLAMAKGDVVGLLNSDDFYSASDILETISGMMEDCEAVYGDVHYVSPDDLQTPVRHYSSAFFRPWLMRLGFMPAHPSFYCRRGIYATYGQFDLDFRVAADFEQLLRLIYINGISTKYIPRDFVTMRVGGASTSGFNSHRRILRDHLRAYRKNNVRSGLIHESLRYAFRLYQLVRFRLTRLTR